MALVVNNIITEGLSGKIGKSGYTFKQVNGKTVFAEKSVSKAEPTPAQLEVREKFKAASEKARADMADSTKKEEWQQAAKNSAGKYTTALGAAIAHYFNAD
jgi:predicted NBD/HSP70 family sugar kinase